MCAGCPESARRSSYRRAAEKYRATGIASHDQYRWRFSEYICTYRSKTVALFIFTEKNVYLSTASVSKIVDHKDLLMSCIDIVRILQDFLLYVR